MLLRTLFAAGLVVATAAPAVHAQPTSPAPAPTPAAAPLTLDEAVRRAIAVSEDVRIAQARSGQAAAAIGRARSALLPSVVATGNYNRRARSVTRDDVTIQSTNAFGASLTAATRLFDARAYPLLRAARRDRDAAVLDERAAQRTIAFDTAAAYIAALAQEQVVEAALRRRELAVARRRDVAARVEAKLVSTNDQTQADLELATADRDLATTQATLAVAYAELAWWVGGPVTGPLVEPPGFTALAAAPPPPVASLATDARRVRPDLGAARVRIDVAEELAKEPARRALPIIDLIGQLRVTNEAGFAGRNHDWLIGVTATWELWDGGERAADSRIRALDVEIARLNLGAAERRTDVDLSAGVARLRGAQAALTPAQEGAAAAARNTDEVAVLYQQGLIRAFDVVDASARRFDADIALVRARLDLAAAWLDLAEAAGAGPVPGQELP